MSLASQSLKVTALAEVVWILAMQVHSPFIFESVLLMFLVPDVLLVLIGCAGCYQTVSSESPTFVDLMHLVECS